MSGSPDGIYDTVFFVESEDHHRHMILHTQYGCCQVDHAKALIDTHQYLMYEISDMLGFDNPYYFSKVFKKVTGMSPREHEKRM